MASLKADLVQLKRDGKVVKAVVGLTPTFDSTSTAKQTSLYKAMNGSGPDTQLIDPVNLKLYKMFEAGPGLRLEADVVNTQVVAGQTSYYWAVLAAPPESVSKVTTSHSGTAQTCSWVSRSHDPCPCPVRGHPRGNVHRGRCARVRAG